MGHAAVRLVDGVNTNRTPTLNEFGLTASQLIRFKYDDRGAILVEKLGGWTKYINTQYPIVRALCAWEDVNALAHLGYGTVNNLLGNSLLGVVTSGADNSITPNFTQSNSVTPAAATTSGSAIVVITDATNTNITSRDAVFIQNQMSVGGLVLFGLYATTAISSTTYSIVAEDALGNPLPATSSSSSVTVPSLATTSGSRTVTVTLANHGYNVGNTFPVLVSTTVGGLVFFGNFVVQSVPSTSTFTIFGPGFATSSTSGSINSGHASYGYNYANVVNESISLAPISGVIDWTLDNWGQVLIACPVYAGGTIEGSVYQPIYFWDPTAGMLSAAVIPQAPTINDGFLVAMPQRQIVAWGSTETGIQDPLLISWCDVNNFNVWIPQITNEAGQYRISRGSKVVACIQGPQQILVWTDVDLWAMQYVGPPYVYDFNEIGTGCGLIARKAAASLGGVIYWMSYSQFFTLSSNGVQPLLCPIWDVVFQQLDTSNLSKIRVAVNSQFNEIAWYFPVSGGSGENTMYVKYNVVLGFWDYGTLGRSAWADRSVVGPPVGFDPVAGYIYQHETSTNADGAALDASFTTGYFALDEADVKVYVDQVWPDMKWGYYGGSQGATVKLTFTASDYPTSVAPSASRTYGPYNLTSTQDFVTPRFRGRLISVGLANTDTGSFWRIGLLRFRYSPDGRY